MFSEEEKKNLKTGYKEVLKALSEKRVKKLYIAEDSSESMQNKLLENGSGVETEFAETMKELGKVCGIEVGASCAALLK